MSLSFLRQSHADTPFEPFGERPSAARLLDRLERALERESVRYCQWKGNWNHPRWASGAGDLDLLIDEAQASAFEAIAERLGFRACAPEDSRRATSVASYLGHDPALAHLVHLHVYRRLLVGRSWWREFHIPLEDLALGTAVRAQQFRVPTPELELLLLTCTATLGQGFRDVLRLRHDPLGNARRHFEHLRARVDDGAIEAVLRERGAPIDTPTFRRCATALASRAGIRRRIQAHMRLERSLRSRAERSLGAAIGHRIGKAISHGTSVRRFGVGPGRKRLASGGVVIALEGADGAGKSTIASGLVRWLSRELLVTHAHLGVPERSPTTLAVGAALKLSACIDRLTRSAPSSVTATLALLRCVCRARDRARIARRVHRFASKGGIAICERYPLPENRDIAGPSGDKGLPGRARGRIARSLRARERRWYEELSLPHVVLVLRVNPETAVRRKVDEPSSYVRQRAERVLRIDWSRRRARVIDAERQLDEVMARVRAELWEALR
jgi:thymidylate kinase